MSGPSYPTVPPPDGRAEVDADAIDSGWDEAEAPTEAAERPPERPSRERMETLHDDDPLRHDIGYRRERDPTRDSRPTLPVINPLRYDVEPESEQAPGGDASGVRRRVR